VILAFVLTIGASAQQTRDVLYLKNGSIIKGSVLEMVPGQNVKIETADGSIFVFKSDEVEKITKENVPSGNTGAQTESISPQKDNKDEVKPAQAAGTVTTNTTSTTGSATIVNTVNTQGPACIIFYRPKKFEGSAAKIIIGSPDPDIVITNLTNGSYFEYCTSDIREWEICTGVYSIDPNYTKITLEPGKKYYVRATAYSKGLTLASRLEIMNESLAKSEMSGLKPLK